LTKQELKQILSIARIRDKAFFCTMFQSGIRPHSLCKPQIEDVQKILERDTPISCKVNVPVQKAKGKFKSYFSFIAKEAVEVLKAYFKTRRLLLNQKSLLFVFHGLTKDGKEKPLNRASITNMFAYYVEKLCRSGAIQMERRVKGKPRELRLYYLRKYFRKQAGSVPFAYLQHWMGHILPASDEHYASKDEELHRQVYEERAMPYLTLDDESSDYKQKIDAIEQYIEVSGLKDFIDKGYTLQDIEKALKSFQRKEAHDTGT
jgi:integrase